MDGSNTFILQDSHLPRRRKQAQHGVQQLGHTLRRELSLQRSANLQLSSPCGCLARSTTPDSLSMHAPLLARPHLLLLPRAQALARDVRRFHPQLLQLLNTVHVLQKQLQSTA